MRRMFLLAIAVAATVQYALALDARDIANLKKNGVQESTIVNMVRANKMPAPLTAREVVMLNASGVSPTLLEFLTRPEASVPAPETPPPVAGVAAGGCPRPSPISSPTVVVRETSCAPTYVSRPTYVASPTYVAPTYVSAPYYYPRYRPYRHYNFGFHFGGRGYRPYGRHWRRW